MSIIHEQATFSEQLFVEIPILGAAAMNLLNSSSVFVGTKNPCPRESI
jgi:hypothetical protein